MSKIINNMAIGDDALKFIDSLLTPEEKAASELRISVIGEMVKTGQKNNKKEISK